MQVLEPTVDRLGRTVAGAGAIEVGQYVSGALGQGPPQRYDLTQGGRDTLAYGVDQRDHQCASLRLVGFAVGGNHLLVDPPGGLDLDVLVGREQIRQPVALLVGEQVGTGVQGPSRVVERVTLAATVPVDGLLGAALDHVQQPRWAGVVADAGQVDDHGDVLVAAAGVAPHVLVDSDHLHPVEPGGVVDQDALALGQDRVVGGVPRDSEAFGDTGDGEVLDDDPFQSPPQTAARQLGPRLGCAAGVLAPHVTAAAAPVPAHVHLQRGGPPPQRLVRQPSGHRVTRDAFAAAAAAPLVRVDDSAGQHRTVGVESLAEDLPGRARPDGRT